MMHRWTVSVLALSVGSVNLGISSAAIAQTQASMSTCQALGTGKYTVLVSRYDPTLRLPNYLAVSAMPCSYLGQTAIFFGNFNSLDPALFRINQLRQFGLNSVIQSFTGVSSKEIPARWQAAAVIVEPQANPNLTLQQVSSLSGVTAQFVSFNNRNVILAAPLLNLPNANSLVLALQKQGFRAEYVDPKFIRPMNSTSEVVPATPVTPTTNLFRVLVPQTNSLTLTQVRNVFPQAFLTDFQGHNYIQASSYANRSFAAQTRDRLAAKFPGTIVVLE